MNRIVYVIDAYKDGKFHHTINFHWSTQRRAENACVKFQKNGETLGLTYSVRKDLREY